MLELTATKSILISIVVGAIIGYIGGPVYILTMWSIIGLFIGWLSKKIKLSFICGSSYGFVLSYVFMLSVYSGTEPVQQKLIPFLVFGIIGAFCGLLLSGIGFISKRYIPKKSKH